MTCANPPKCRRVAARCRLGSAREPSGSGRVRESGAGWRRTLSARRCRTSIGGSDALAEHEQRERQCRHALGPKARHEPLGDRIDAAAGERDPAIGHASSSATMPTAASRRRTGCRASAASRRLRRSRAAGRVQGLLVARDRCRRVPPPRAQPGREEPAGDAEDQAQVTSWTTNATRRTQARRAARARRSCRT